MSIFKKAADDFLAKKAKAKEEYTPPAPNILVWDIETTPAKVSYNTYDLRQRSKYIPHKYVEEPGEMASWAAGWIDTPSQVEYMDLHQEGMYQRLWELLDKADYTVTYNGDRFDHKKVRGYFARLGMAPPSSSKSIDLYKTAAQLGFESKSLEYVCRLLNTPHQKLVEETGGAWQLWEGVVKGDETSRKLMRTYAVGDVRATADLYVALLPWIKNHPNMNKSSEHVVSCPRCGSEDYTNAGTYLAQVIRYQEHRCTSCKGLFRSVFHSRQAFSKSL